MKTPTLEERIAELEAHARLCPHIRTARADAVLAAQSARHHEIAKMPAPERNAIVRDMPPGNRANFLRDVGHAAVMICIEAPDEARDEWAQDLAPWARDMVDLALVEVPQLVRLETQSGGRMMSRNPFPANAELRKRVVGAGGSLADEYVHPIAVPSRVTSALLDVMLEIDATLRADIDTGVVRVVELPEAECRAELAADWTRTPRNQRRALPKRVAR